jgi:hypothetical protein
MDSYLNTIALLWQMGWEHEKSDGWTMCGVKRGTHSSSCVTLSDCEMGSSSTCERDTEGGTK